MHKDIREEEGQFYVDQDHVLLQGETCRGGLYARKIHQDGQPYGTFRTYTMLIRGSHVQLKHMTIANTAGPGKEVGQALALYCDGDELRVENCRITGHQDTLFLAPLPPTEVQHNGFLGPGQFTPRTNHTMYFSNCLIEGGVDFVFGGAEAYFDNCEFRSVEPGYVFAPSTPQGREGFVCRNCAFTAEPSLEKESCWLGRPWRDYARVRLENCWLGAHIRPEGWHDWNKPQAHQTARFEEIGSKGPGAEHACRPDWVIFH